MSGTSLGEHRFVFQQAQQKAIADLDVKSTRKAFRAMRESCGEDRRSDICVFALGFTLGQLAVFTVLNAKSR